MESFKQWLLKSFKQDSSQTEQKVEVNREADVSPFSKQASETSCSVDPKVEEFFKDFPEPFRKRLIERYSLRKGMYRYDFIRDIAMKHEIDCAARGMILEEKRIQEEYEEEREEEHRQQMLEEFRQSRKDRKVPEWEKSVQTVIPLQDGETMGFKLIQTVNLSALGLAILWGAVQKRKAQPPISRLRLGIGIFGSLNLFVICQMGALYRLMDWGIFDRSIDDRDVITKAIDELKKSSPFSLEENSQGISSNKPDT